MTDKQKHALLTAWNWCDDMDKSTEFMLQYMSDMSGVDYEDVVEYVTSEEAKKDFENFLKDDTQKH